MVFCGFSKVFYSFLRVLYGFSMGFLELSVDVLSVFCGFQSTLRSVEPQSLRSSCDQHMLPNEGPQFFVDFSFYQSIFPKNQIC